MSSTHFSDGQQVTATFMNTIFYNSHVHDGTDADGHASKIDITRDTTGNIASDRIDWVTDGSFIAQFADLQYIDVTCYYKIFPSTLSGMPEFVQLYIPETGGTVGEETIISSTAIPAAIQPSPGKTLEAYFKTDGTEEMARVVVGGSIAFVRYVPPWKNDTTMYENIFTYAV